MSMEPTEHCLTCGQTKIPEDLETCPYCLQDLCKRCVLERLFIPDARICGYKCAVCSEILYTNLEFTEEEVEKEVKQRKLPIRWCGTCQ
jgi:hypothetical protein